MCARFTVLSDTPIAAAIAGWAIPLSRNNTIWMRWRCAAGIFQRNAVFSRRTSALLHLTICFPRIRWRKRITPRARKIAPDYRPRIPIQAVMEAVLECYMKKIAAKTYTLAQAICRSRASTLPQRLAYKTALDRIGSGYYHTNQASGDDSIKRTERHDKSDHVDC